jgi:5-methyltetrahydropteroyltriglutamate--homocysteine methyltransferase
MNEPAIKTTVVGSYPIPSWLGIMPTSANLRDAVMAVLKTQELAGLDVISDGELSRFNINHPETNGMIEYFVSPLGGIESNPARAELETFSKRAAMKYRSRPTGVVRAKISEGRLDLPAAWKSVRSLTASPLKFTVTSPYMLAKTLLDKHYGDVRALAWDIAEILAKQVAEIDAAVLQVDEAHLPGHPEDALWAHEPINRILNAARGSKAVHLCFGNYGGQTIQQGCWRDLLPFLNNLSADHLLLEFARRGEGELDRFKELRDGLALGLGVIDIKDNEVETPEAIARSIEQFVRVLGGDRIKWLHPDCGLWMLPRTVADRKMATLVAGRNLFAGFSSNQKMAIPV